MKVELRLRKFSPIDREYPIYEVVVGDEVLFDIGRSDSGDYEFSVHAASSGRVVPLPELIHLMEEAKKLLAEE